MKWIFIAAVFLLIPLVSGQACQDGQEQSCGYNDVGECKLGNQICQNGYWSQCFGAKYPGQEVCFDNKDNNCDGKVDENCVCQDETQRKCGPETDDGICEFGMEKCQDNIWRSCEGAVYPMFGDICYNNLDDDCDKEIDEGCQTQQTNNSINNLASNACFNKIKDGSETDVDCGGSCMVCPSCSDGILNQNELRVHVNIGNGTFSDCGGLKCVACPTCFDNVKNQGEIGVDCGGECKACETVKDDDKDNDGLIDEQELLMGTNPLNMDTDGDGKNDKTDTMALCPNKVCDKKHGEDSDTCPEDCGSGKGGVVIGIIAFVLVLLAFFMYKRFKKSASTIKTSGKKEQSVMPGFDVLKYRELEEKKRKMKERKTNVEESIERSFEKVDRYLKK